MRTDETKFVQKNCEFAHPAQLQFVLVRRPDCTMKMNLCECHIGSESCSPLPSSSLDFFELANTSTTQEHDEVRKLLKIRGGELIENLDVLRVKDHVDLDRGSFSDQVNGR